MTNYDLEEAKLVKIQIGLTVISVFTIIISLYLSYNTLKDLEKKEKIFDEDTAYQILRINRTIALFLALTFLCINIYDKEIKLKYKKDLEDANIQILSSVLTTIAAILVLYVSFNGNLVTLEENPEI